MITFVDLSRRFSDLTSAELDGPELLASLGDGGFLRADGWAEVLRHRRVVLLAEAGSGKTREMREQAARLRADGRFAFFIALEDLDRDGLAGSLPTSAEERALAEWLADSSAPAWFFLDSVDELKLARGKLQRALGRLAKGVGGALDRAHVVVSCRPTDWRSVQDREAVREALPLPRRGTTPTPQMSAEEAFAAALREAESGQRDNKGEGDGAAREEQVRIVAMLPLGERQIEAFAPSLGVGDPTAFVAEIRRRDAWTFARRPLDLMALAEVWRDTGEFGTREQQHESNIAAKLKDDPERADRGVLSATLAREGAERLALALALCRRQTVLSPEQALHPERAAGALDPAAVLPDWTDEQQQSLLRRALFDPATYGRVRFHHRSVQEYLAARRLAALREKGMTARALIRLLFAERYGVRLAIPSMRPVAAWLALWDVDVRRELVAREPEALLSLGDPEALPLATRAGLLRAVASARGRTSGAGLNVPIAEARRLAHPDLAEVIRELWQSRDPGDDVRELPLEMVRQGRMEACADLAEDAVRDTSLPDHLRVLGFRALVACGRDDAARRIAGSVVHGGDTWPGRLAILLVPDLFPGFISVRELMALVERTPEPKYATGGFGWLLRKVAEEVDPWSGRALELRSGLADLLWRGRHERLEWHRSKSRFDHLAPALAILCARQLTDPYRQLDPGLIRAAALANRFGRDRFGADEVRGRLKRCFGQEDTVRREAAFWAEVSLMDEVAPTDEDRRRFYYAQHDALFERLVQADRIWLEAALADRADPRRHGVALQALLELWVQRGRPEAEGEALRSAAAGDPRLSAEAIRRTAPPQSGPSLEKMWRDERRLEFVRRGREQRRLASWTRWRDALLADPEAAFGPEELPRSVANIYAWLSSRHRDRTRYDVWDAAALEAAFGPEVARRADEAFRALWRAEQPVLWSRRPVEERDTTPLAWARSLCGLAAEAAVPGWASRLTTDEARTAAAYATVEMNGFPRWMPDLAIAHPGEVASVLGEELAAELAVGADHQHLPVLHSLRGAGSALIEALAPRLAEAVAAWPSPLDTAAAGRNSAGHLATVLPLLDEAAGSTDQRQSMAAVCRARYSADPAGPLAPAWLQGLFRFDPAGGVDALEAGLDTLDGAARDEKAVATLAALFGERDGDLLRPVDPAMRPALLGRLVRCAYLWVRREDDVEREGIYYVGTRDHAETARNFLLSALLETPGQAVHDVLLSLAADPLFAHLADRLRSWARQRAAADAEPAALSAADVAKLEARLHAPPHDRDGLFDVMLDRLGDLSHDVAHDDFNIRRTLQGIRDEDEMQRYVAGQLRGASRGAYVVVREDEVADRKRTDIRLAAVRGGLKAVAGRSRTCPPPPARRPVPQAPALQGGLPAPHPQWDQEVLGVPGHGRTPGLCGDGGPLGVGGPGIGGGGGSRHACCGVWAGPDGPGAPTSASVSVRRPAAGPRPGPGCFGPSGRAVQGCQ